MAASRSSAAPKTGNSLVDKPKGRDLAHVVANVQPGSQDAGELPLRARTEIEVQLVAAAECGWLLDELPTRSNVPSGTGWTVTRAPQTSCHKRPELLLLAVPPQDSGFQVGGMEVRFSRDTAFPQ
jgi:hypothetical protein